MKGNEWRVLRAKERTCFLFFRGLWSKINFNLFYTFLLCVCVCVILWPYWQVLWQVQNQLDVILGKKWRSKWQGKESTSLQVTLFPLMTYLSPLSSFMVMLFFLCSSENGKKIREGKREKTFQTTCLRFNGLKVFVCLEVSNVDFFFPIPTFSWHPNKTSFHFSHMESCFFFSLILYLSKRHY